MSSGRCLCGAVRYEISGPLRDVSVCHCVECRRWHGNPGGYTAAPRDALRLTGAEHLRWIDGPDSNEHARRGFCGECGSSLVLGRAGPRDDLDRRGHAGLAYGPEDR
jgi:hypothetical protein